MIFTHGPQSRRTDTAAHTPTTPELSSLGPSLYDGSQREAAALCHGFPAWILL